MRKLKILFVGYFDHRKSTITVRLLYETHSLSQGVIDKVQKIADETGKNFVVSGESVGTIIEDEFFNKHSEIVVKIEDKSPSISNRLPVSVFWLGKSTLSIGKNIN